MLRGNRSVRVLLLASLCTAPQVHGGEVQLQPFTATYGVEWHGITAGYSMLEFKSTGPDTYIYSSHIRARGIFRLAFPNVRTQTSTFRIEAGHLLPLTYREEGGSKDENVDLEFDWNALRARGMAEGKPVDAPLQPGTQDPFSVQIELMRDLLAGDVPHSFLLFDKDEVKQFDYTRERDETLDTPLGRLETVVYRSDRPGNDRITRLWLAPSLSYMPVQAERERRGKVDFSLRVREVKRAVDAGVPGA